MTSAMPGPRQVKRATLSSLVTEQLREAILSGAYGLGTQLNEKEIAEKCGVSRGPVREAIQRLVQEGLLYSEPHRGVFVPELTDEDLADIYFVRAAVESAAIRRVTSLGKGAEVARALSGTVKAMSKALARQDWARLAEHDMTFHTLLIEAAGSFRLSRMYATLVAEMRLCLTLLVGGYRGRQGLIEEHEILTELVRRGDLEAALDALARHLTEPVESLRLTRDSLSGQGSKDRGGRRRAPGLRA